MCCQLKQFEAFVGSYVWASEAKWSVLWTVKIFFSFSFYYIKKKKKSSISCNLFGLQCFCFQGDYSMKKKKQQLVFLIGNSEFVL